METPNKSYFVNGALLDDDSVTELVTAITSTSPIAVLPSLKHLYPAQRSLSKVAALAKCRKLIVFDGVSPMQEQWSGAYEEYKERVLRLTEQDPVFQNTELVFCKDWVHLSGSLEKAIMQVKTQFVFIHQHDDVLTKPFDINGCVASMMKNSNIKHIHLARYANKGRKSGEMQNSWDGPVDSIVEGGSEVPLTRCFGWSDYSHLTSTDYLRTFVLSRCGHGFPETFIHKNFKTALVGESDAELAAIHREFGTYLYGSLSDGNYIHHSDGSRDLSGGIGFPANASSEDDMTPVCYS